jgi:hypothetical protein
MKKIDIGGELTDLPNEHYRKFLDKFKEIDTLDIKEYKPVHLIAYFIKKYEDAYNAKYKLKFNSPQPSKCFEIFQIKKLAMMLSSNPTIIKPYIDWVFEKLIKNKKRITSISFLTKEDVLKEYKMTVLFINERTSNIDRSTPLPQKYLDVFCTHDVLVNTYGDLAFISQMSPIPVNIAAALDSIDKLGFDRSILVRIV